MHWRFIFFFKQKTAYEMRPRDGVQTCALPIWERERERELTCKIAPEFVASMGRDIITGYVASKKSTKSIDASPRRPALDDPCKDVGNSWKISNREKENCIYLLLRQWNGRFFLWIFLFLSLWLISQSHIQDFPMNRFLHELKIFLISLLAFRHQLEPKKSPAFLLLDVAPENINQNWARMVRFLEYSQTRTSSLRCDRNRKVEESVYTFLKTYLCCLKLHFEDSFDLPFTAPCCRFEHFPQLSG